MREFLHDFLGITSLKKQMKWYEDEAILRHREMMKRMALNAADLQAAMNTATDEIASDLQTLKDNLAAAVADKDEAAQAAVQEALAGFEAPIARLQAMGQDDENPVPDAPPAEGTEDPGNEPGEIENPAQENV